MNEKLFITKWGFWLTFTIAVLVASFIGYVSFYDVSPRQEKVADASDVGQEQWVEIVVDRTGNFGFFHNEIFIVRGTNGKNYIFTLSHIKNRKDMGIAQTMALLRPSDRIVIKMDNEEQIKDLRFSNPGP